MADEQLNDEQAARAEAERHRVTAQETAAELARMGIDPRALGLADNGAANPEVPLDPIGSVVPLRPEFDRSSLPASGTSTAWALEPPRLGGSPTPSLATPTEVDALFTNPRVRAPGALSGYLARSITYGLLTPDAAESVDRERQMIARVRTRTTEPQSTVLVSGKGGVGVTTVALAIGTVFAALREDTCCVATLRSGVPSLGVPLTGRRAIAARDLNRSGSEAELTRLPNGLCIVDGADWSAPVRRSEVPGVLDRIQQTANIALYDVGNDTGDASGALLSRADQVVVVTSGGADGLPAVQAAVERIGDRDPLSIDTAIFVVVCRHETALKRVVRRMREVLPGPARVVAVPPDDYLADGNRFDPGMVGVATRLAFLDIAGLVALGSRPR
jgi:MinD-like ATPase involved in chromosome partitioning or flagellar assembly